MSFAKQLAELSERLRGLSALGLQYAEDEYNRERYGKVQAVAMELFALATGEPPSSLEPIRQTSFAHPTPFTGTDAAILDESERVFLIRRTDNGLWAMPGGFSDTAETPAQTAVRETLEETGLRVDAILLGGIFDSRLSHTPDGQHMYHFVFICRPSGHPSESASDSREVLETGWFPIEALPADMDPGHCFRLPIAMAVWRNERSAHFD